MKNKIFVAFTIANLIGLIYLFFSLNDGLTISQKTRDEITGFNDYVEMHKVSVVCKNGTKDCKVVN